MRAKKILSLIIDPKYTWQFILVYIYGYLTSLLLYNLILNRNLDQILIFNHKPLSYAIVFIVTTFSLFFLWFYSLVQNSKISDSKIFFKKSSYLLIILSLFSFLAIILSAHSYHAVQNLGLLRIFILGISLASFFIFFLFNLNNIKDKLNKTPAWSIYVLILFAMTIYIANALIKHSYWFADFAGDLGIADQVIWQYSKFQIPAASSILQIPNIWADHFHPLWILIAPFYWIWDNVQILLIIDSIIVCLGALPLFWLIRDWLKNNFIALCFAFGYLFYFGVQTALNFPFHGETLATTFLIFAIYFIFKRKWFWYFVMIILILAAKESFGLYVAFLGLYIFWVRKEYLVGTVSLFTGLFYAQFVASWLMPQFWHAQNRFLTFYNQLGSNSFKIIKTFLTNPLYIFYLLITLSIKLSALITIFLPVAFLSFLAPSFLILALPIIGERFLSTTERFWPANYMHYGITITPIIFLSTALAIKNFNIRAKNIFTKLISMKFDLAQFSAIYIVITTILLTFFLNIPTVNLVYSNYYHKPNFADNINKVINQIPKNASISTSDTIVTHLSHRYKIYRFPKISDTEFIVLDIELMKRKATYPTSEEDFKKKLTLLINENQYGIKMVNKTTILFQKNIQDEMSINPEIKEYLNYN